MLHLNESSRCAWSWNTSNRSQSPIKRNQSSKLYIVIYKTQNMPQRVEKQLWSSILSAKQWVANKSMTFSAEAILPLTGMTVQEKGENQGINSTYQRLLTFSSKPITSEANILARSSAALHSSRTLAYSFLKDSSSTCKHQILKIVIKLQGKRRFREGRQCT